MGGWSILEKSANKEKEKINSQVQKVNIHRCQYKWIWMEVKPMNVINKIIDSWID
jgi:hypothetical protein